MCGVVLTPGLRRWLALALLGACVVAAWPVLAHLYWIEQAGSLLDRYIVSADDRSLTRARDILGLSSGQAAPPAPAAPPEPGTAADSSDYWRTYGAVAAQAPSQEAFEDLFAARERGTLDRMGRLWLAEVAAATGHWSVAAEEYSRMDAVNLLIDRGDDALAAGLPRTAGRWYGAAAIALVTREGHGSSGQADDSPGSLFEVGAGRTMLLLRAGRGLLRSGDAAGALPALEAAEAALGSRPPGVRDQQSIRFALAEALVRAPRLDPEEARERTTRIDRLLDRAVRQDETGWARRQEAGILLIAGERARAIAALRASVRLDPRDVDSHLILGGLYEEDGLPAHARDQYASGLAAVPADTRLLVAYAKAAFATRSPERALPSLVAAAKTATGDPDLFAAWGDCLLEMGDPVAARAAYREGLRRAPATALLAERIGRYVRPTGAPF